MRWPREAPIRKVIRALERLGFSIVRDTSDSKFIRRISAYKQSAD